ncbi:MAG: hypothetical protein JSS55_03135 [Proteobacteria bacterium]|nr:hypothetical protein [Pseudomonadota bacterium]
MLDALIAVDDPHRAARMLALLGDAGGVMFRQRAAGDGERIAELAVMTPHSAEQIVEIACAEGFHAEPVGRGVEFWIDEHCLFLLRTAAGVMPLAA